MAPRQTRTVEVPEITIAHELTLPARESALVVVDMQNDFVRPEGALVVPDAPATVRPVAELLARARDARVRVAYTQDTHFQGDREWEIWPPHCRRESWGWKIIDELAPRPAELVVEKHRYDGFYGTSLEHYLLNVWHIRDLIVVGTVANICVLHTAGSAGLRWLRVVVPADCLSAQTPFDHVLTLRQISWLYAGVVMDQAADVRFT